MISNFMELSRATKVVVITAAVVVSILAWCVSQTSGSVANSDKFSSVGNTIVTSTTEKNQIINNAQEVK